MTLLQLFTTPVIRVKTNLDLNALEQKCLEFQKVHSSEQYSNAGGYHSPGFTCEELDELIHDNVPIVDKKPIEYLDAWYWVNINGPGHFNRRHSHDPHHGTFLSGVFYVKVPEDSGRICFHDPRPHISTAPDMKYYNNGDNAWCLETEPNVLLIFPPWLEHSVEVNESSENRISIAFNLFNLKHLS